LPIGSPDSALSPASRLTSPHDDARSALKKAIERLPLRRRLRRLCGPARLVRGHDRPEYPRPFPARSNGGCDARPPGRPPARRRPDVPLLILKDLPRDFTPFAQRRGERNRGETAGIAPPPRLRGSYRPGTRLTYRYDFASETAYLDTPLRARRKTCSAIAHPVSARKSPSWRTRSLLRRRRFLDELCRLYARL